RLPARASQHQAEITGLWTCWNDEEFPTKHTHLREYDYGEQAKSTKKLPHCLIENSEFDVCC
ncbi:MAG: hypothetical protein K9M45_14040, partial [Kiritimatiellales bacterium]|nr:hypothetical protein [Kiritimatiellales bacterium]